MRLKQARVCMELTQADVMPLEQLSVDGQILLIMEYWDGGAREGCVFVEKTEKAYVLWEYTYPYFTHDGEARRYTLAPPESVAGIVKEIENFCNTQYYGVDTFDFSAMCRDEAICRFFAEK